MMNLLNAQTISTGFSTLLQEAVTKLSRELYVQKALQFPHLAADLLNVMIEAEAEAWETEFPHLLLPDLVEVKVARLLLPGAQAMEAEVCSLALAA